MVRLSYDTALSRWNESHGSSTIGIERVEGYRTVNIDGHELAYCEHIDRKLFAADPNGRSRRELICREFLLGREGLYECLAPETARFHRRQQLKSASFPLKRAIVDSPEYMPWLVGLTVAYLRRMVAGDYVGAYAPHLGRVRELLDMIPVHPDYEQRLIDELVERRLIFSVNHFNFYPDFEKVRLFDL